MEDNKDYRDTSDYEDITEDMQTISETQMIESLTDPDYEDKKKYSHKPDNNPPVKKKKKKKNSATHEVLSFIMDLVICMAVVLVVTNYVVTPVQVKGSSMYPTLEDGSLGFSDIIGYRMTGIKRFDVVVVYLEEKNEYLVKRVVGLPGETVSYKDGQLYIDGEAVDEPFFDEDYKDSYGSLFMSDVDPITLGDDEYYCLGDNRPHSSDSRYYGPFKKEDIRSKGIFIYWPFSDFGVKTW